MLLKLGIMEVQAHLQPNIDTALAKAASALGFTLKPELLKKFVSGKDIFISLPTGFGKSLCYRLLPPIFDIPREVNRKSIVLVVSPLIALMKDQVGRFKEMGINATYRIHYYFDKTGNKERGLSNLFISPEALILGTEWMSMLSSSIYRLNLVGFIVDEAHCIKKWGEKFRSEFSHLDEVQSIIPETVQVMALTATATKTTRKFIIQGLSLQTPENIYVPPARDNILMDKPKGDNAVSEVFKCIMDK